MKWKKINSKIVYKNPWIEVVEDAVIRPDGKKGKYSIVKRSPVNFIIALSPKKSIFIIKEYRYPIKKNIIQLPAGTTDKGETYLSTAKKELFEETGIKAKNWEKLGKFFIGAGHENIFANVFLATNLDMSKFKKSRKKGNELILNVAETSIVKIKKMILTGKIECGISLAALNIFFLKYKI